MTLILEIISRYNVKHIMTLQIKAITSILNHIGGVMVSVLVSSAGDRGFEPRSGQTKDYRIGICCFPGMQAALRKKNKDCLARNQDIVSEWSYMSIRELLFQ